MESREYEKDVLRTARSFATVAEAVQWAVNGLNAEAGEVAALLQKREQGHDLSDEMLDEEVGDVMYFATFLSYLVNPNGLHGTLTNNIRKRQKRYPTGFDPERSRNREG